MSLATNYVIWIMNYELCYVEYWNMLYLRNFLYFVSFANLKQWCADWYDSQFAGWLTHRQELTDWSSFKSQLINYSACNSQTPKPQTCKSQAHILEALEFWLCMQRDIKAVIWTMLISQAHIFQQETVYVKLDIKCNKVSFLFT